MNKVEEYYVSFDKVVKLVIYFIVFINKYKNNLKHNFGISIVWRCLYWFFFWIIQQQSSISSINCLECLWMYLETN